MNNSPEQQRHHDLLDQPDLIVRPVPRFFSESFQQTLQLQLHSSLDIKTIIRYFLENLKEFIPLDGMSYHYPKLSIHCHSGLTTEHALQYELNRAEQKLGELTLYHQQGFIDAETKKLEELLPTLILPLSNAIEYMSALQSAMYDPLTQVPNRCAFELALTREITIAQRHATSFALLSIDIDHFKLINDNFGHQAGDEYLFYFATKIKEVCRNSDTVFRLGGEEFMVLLNQTDVTGALNLAVRIRSAIASMAVNFHHEYIQTTASIGVAAYTPGDNEESLTTNADQALYRAKHQGRNRVCT